MLQSSLALAGVVLLPGCGLPLPGAPMAKMPTLGLLSILGTDAVGARGNALRDGLPELGYIDGKTIVLEARYGDGREERGPELAAELVGLNVDVIVSMTAGGIRPATRATSTVPIVMVADNADPITAGYVASSTGRQRHRTHRAGRGDDAEAPGVQALTIVHTSIFGSARSQMVALTAQHRMPTITNDDQFTGAGGLMSYGVDRPDNYRFAASYVDKLLKGARPADLPMERPRKYDLRLNLKRHSPWV